MLGPQHVERLAHATSRAWRSRAHAGRNGCRRWRRRSGGAGLRRGRPLEQHPDITTSDLGAFARRPARSSSCRSAACAARRSRSATASARCRCGVPSAGLRHKHLAGGGLPLRLALVEQRRDLVGSRLRLLRLAASRLASALSSPASSPLPSSASRRSDRASAPASSPAWLPARLLLRRQAAAARSWLTSSSFLSVTFATGVVDRLRRVDLLDQRRRRLAPSARSSRPWSFRRTPCRRRYRPAGASVRLGLERPRRKRDQPPQQQGCVDQRRNRQAGLHLRQLHGALLHLRDQRDAAEAGGGEPSHDLHHRTIIHGLIAANIDALVGRRRAPR